MRFKWEEEGNYVCQSPSSSLSIRGGGEGSSFPECRSPTESEAGGWCK